jgi:hypothetical protein
LDRRLIKIKPLTKSQIKVSLDRLTRFKFTEDKYLRVFKEIIISNLIEPKFKKSQLDAMPYPILTEIASEIFNYSAKLYSENLDDDMTINKKLKAYEKSLFVFDKFTDALLDNKIRYSALIKSLDKDDIPINLKWLISLGDSKVCSKNRQNYELLYPLEKIVITEGITEEILLPEFAKFQNFNFKKDGIFVISAGGKNQVVKLFYRLAEVLKLPIFVLLDNDAEENYKEILPKLRNKDKVHVLESGEFEDTLPLPLVLKTLNNHLKNFSKVELSELKQDLPMTRILEEIFKEKGFGEFKKSEFAHLVAQNLTKDDISDEINQVFSEIKNMPEIIK